MSITASHGSNMRLGISSKASRARIAAAVPAFLVITVASTPSHASSQPHVALFIILLILASVALIDWLSGRVRRRLIG